MKTIAIISQKGGAGKTTAAVHLATAAALAGHRAAIIDLEGHWITSRPMSKASHNAPL
jgi:cellulose biosynthesis protein BcsQ